MILKELNLKLKIFKNNFNNINMNIEIKWYVWLIIGIIVIVAVIAAAKFLGTKAASTLVGEVPSH